MNHKKIIVCGRGYSFKYFKKFINDYDIVIGYNQKDNLFFNKSFYSLNKEGLIRDDKNIWKESKLTQKSNTDIIKVGSTTFGLYTLLSYIQNEYPKSIVDLVGFDFRLIYENSLIKNLNDDGFIQPFVNIESQKIFSLKLKRFFDNIIIRFISFDENSDIDPKTGKEIDRNNENNVEIVAEITTNHFGDTDRLISLIKGAKISGANSVKLQMRDVESFYSNDQLNEKYDSPFGKKFIDYRKGLELSNEQIKIVDKVCKEIGIKYFFSVLDFPSFKKISSINPERIKLPSTISNKRDYISHALKFFRGDIVISTGMTDNEYIDFILKKRNLDTKIFMLHCISSYPVNIFNSNLNIIKKFSNLGPNIIPGYSSHDIGEKGSVYAIFCGAKMIEKHIKLGNSNFAHFDETALDVNLEFPEFVQNIRNAEVILGSMEKKIMECEHHKY